MQDQDEISGRAMLVLNGADHSEVGYHISFRQNGRRTRGGGHIEGPTNTMYDAVDALDVVLRLENGEEIPILVTNFVAGRATIYVKGPGVEE